jgi:Ca-activated chloride channel family protein
MFALVFRFPLAMIFALLAFSLATPHRAGCAGMLVAEGGLGSVLAIKEQNVRVTINNQIAVTQIDQTFVNMENRIVEALYTFPVPSGASVSNVRMWIAGKEMIGEVVENQRAR